MCWHPQAQQNMAEEKKIPLSFVDLLPFFDYVEKTGSRTEPDNPKQAP
jgi:hypothetical protein